MIVGGIVGFAVARMRGRDKNGNAKLAALQQEYDDYRASVRNHFIDTVSAISQIDEQQKKLYRSVADGVTELCQPQSGEEDYFIEQTMQTLGELEPPKKDRKSTLDLS